MSNTWIGNIIMSSGDKVSDDSGDKIFNLFPCTGGILDYAKYPSTAKQVNLNPATIDDNTTTAALTDAYMQDGLGNLIGTANPALISLDGIVESEYSLDALAEPIDDRVLSALSNTTGDLHYISTDAGIYETNDGLIYSFTEAWPAGLETNTSGRFVKSSDNAIFAWHYNTYSQALIKPDGGSWTPIVIGNGSDIEENLIESMDGAGTLIIASTRSGSLYFTNDSFATQSEISGTYSFGSKIGLFNTRGGFVVVDFNSSTIYPLDASGVLGEPVIYQAGNFVNVVMMHNFLHFTTDLKTIVTYQHYRHQLTESAASTNQPTYLLNNGLVFLDDVDLIGSYTPAVLTLPTMPELTSSAPFKLISELEQYEEDAHFDPYNMATLWQDTARTVPVTAADDPVLGITDLSGNDNHATIVAGSGGISYYRVNASGQGYLELAGGSEIVVSNFGGFDKRIYFQIPYVGDTSFTAANLSFGDGAIGVGIFTFYDIGERSPTYYNIYTAGTVTTLSGLFKDKATFNEPIGHWKTEDIEDLSFFLENATAFNRDINTLNVSKVTSLVRAFAGTQSYDRTMSNWVTSALTNVNGMLADATAYNKDLMVWDISNVGENYVDFVTASSALDDAFNPFYIPLFSSIGQIGDVIITSETQLLNSEDTVVADLLECDGSTYDIVARPDLYAILGTNVLPDIPTETGSPHPYKIVADIVVP